MRCALGCHPVDHVRKQRGSRSGVGCLWKENPKCRMQLGLYAPWGVEKVHESTGHLDLRCKCKVS